MPLINLMDTDGNVKQAVESCHFVCTASSMSINKGLTRLRGNQKMVPTTFVYSECLRRKPSYLKETRASWNKYSISTVTNIENGRRAADVAFQKFFMRRRGRAFRLELEERRADSVD